jgi:electron transport complex protein RnfB
VMDRELARMYEDYFHGGFVPKTHALRTVPINQIVDVQSPILPFDDVKKIIESKSKIGLVQCACAARMRMLGSQCKRPQEVCIGFDFYAEYGIEELGVGRWITQQEAIDVIIQSEEAGLVHQTGGNSISTECICNCCPDCCVSLRAFKLFPQPARLAGSNYYAQLNQDECTLCESCVDRCPMNAISVNEDNASIDLDRCLGCGLCTSVCPVEAITLQTKGKVKPPPSPEKYKFMRPSIDFYRDLEKE